MATKLMLKGDAANPAKWSDEFLAKVAEAGDHAYFTRQIFSKWWKKGLDDVFKGGGAQLDMSLEPSGFTWTVKTLTDAGKKALAADKELAEVATHKGKCSGYAPKEEAPPEPKKAEPKEEPKPEPKKGKPKVDVEDLKQLVRSTPSLGAKDDVDKYTARLKRVLEADFDGVTDKHLEAVKGLALKTYFQATEEEPEKAPEKAAKPTLTTQQAAAIDAALREAERAANSGMLDNDDQVALGDAITSALGGKNKTHSRSGGHKGSFTKAVSIGNALKNAATPLSSNLKEALEAHLQANWKAYSVY